MISFPTPPALPRRLWAGLTFALVPSVPALAAPEAPARWRIEITGPWEVDGAFEKGRDLSAAASLGGGNGFVASDETRSLQSVTIRAKERRLTAGDSVPLTPGKGTELDLEGLAYSPSLSSCFATGSHGLARKRKVVEESRSSVFRLPLDELGNPRPDQVKQASLRPALLADPILGPFLDRDEESGGVDIEGLAERDGRLFFALRAPSFEGGSYVIETGVAELFGDRGAPAPRRHELPLGPGLGSRDLVALDSGEFLLLAGPSGAADPGVFSIWVWPGPGLEPRKVGDLPAGTVKAEAILPIAQTPDSVEGVLLFDGEKNGGPLGFRLQRERPAVPGDD